jgi:hypothetical protein
MPTDWKSFCGNPSLKVEGNRIDVSLEGDRHQFIEVSISDEVIYLHSIVAHPAPTSRFENASLRAWERNRAISIVAFRIDEKGRMVGEAWVPSVGLTRDEFLIYVKTMAIECDRFEYQITGDDVH